MQRPTHTETVYVLSTRCSHILLSFCSLCAFSCATSTPTPSAPNVVDHDQSHIPAEPEGLWSNRWISPSAYAHYTQARIHHNNNDLSKALQHIQLALVFDEESAHLHAYAAHLFVLNDQTDEAQKALTTAFQIQPHYAYTHAIHARFLQHTGAPPEDVLQTAKRATQLHPKLRKAHIFYAQLLMRKEHTEPALRALETIARLWPDDPFAHNHLGRLSTARNEHRNALKHFTRLLELRPRSERVFVHIAATHQRLDEHQKAYDTLVECTERTPPASTCWAHRLLTHPSNPKPPLDREIRLAAEALAVTPTHAHTCATVLLDAHTPHSTSLLSTFARLSSTINPTLYELHHHLGHAYLLEKRNKEALQAFLLVPKSSAYFIEARSQIALLYAHDKRYDRAAISLNPAIQHDPSLLDLRLLQSTLWERHGDLRKALTPLTNAPKDAQNHPDLLKRTAHLYTETRQKTKAIQALQTLLTTHPKHPFHSATLALLLSSPPPRPNARTLQRAHQLARDSLRADPTRNPSLLHTIARVFLNTGSSTEALELLTEAHQKRPADLAILRTLTHTLITIQQRERALSVLQKAQQRAQDQATREKIQALRKTYRL